MKFLFIILFLFLSLCGVAQEITYSIYCPPGASEGMGKKELPDSIDTLHFYTSTEIKVLAVPANGWGDFYVKMRTLDYPLEAKKKKLQSAMTIEYKIDEDGRVDSVSIASIESGGRWDKCTTCEELILDYFRNTKWTPGKIRETPVKTVHYSYVVFDINDPNSKEPKSVFGY